MSMKFFGTEKLFWKGPDDKNHALVAVRGGNWNFFCHARSDQYETVDSAPQPTTDPVVWDPDREKIDCDVCKQLLDGKTIDELIEFKRVDL